MKRKMKNIVYKFWTIGTNFVVLWEFLERLWFWIPFLWKDRDWDYGCLLNMMKAKMLRLANTIEDNAFIEGNERTAKQLRWACFLIDVMQDGDRLPRVKALADAIEAKWGPRCEATPEQLAWGAGIGWLFIRQNMKSVMDYIQYMEEFSVYAQELFKAEADAQKRLFKHMDAYIGRWWD